MFSKSIFTVQLNLGISVPWVADTDSSLPSLVHVKDALVPGNSTLQQLHLQGCSPYLSPMHFLFQLEMHTYRYLLLQWIVHLSLLIAHWVYHTVFEEVHLTIPVP